MANASGLIALNDVWSKLISINTAVQSELLTSDVQLYFESVIHIVLGGDLAQIDPSVVLLDVLYDQTPFVRSLIVIDAKPGVRSKRKQPDRQWMLFPDPSPSYLDRSCDSAFVYFKEDLLVHVRSN